MNKSSTNRLRSFNQEKNNLLSCSSSPKLSLIYILAICVTLLILFQIQSLHTLATSLNSPPPPNSWSLLQKWQSLVFNPQTLIPSSNCNTTTTPDSITQKLRDSVTFLPLKDLRFSNRPLQGRTWFMSSMDDTRHVEGGVQHLQFPSNSSNSRLLCFKGKDTHDGSFNYYGLAWPEALPSNATLRKGLTFISYNHYDYINIWHGLSALYPFVAWHWENNCEIPTRWILYHWGELRFGLPGWLNKLMEATFGQVPYIERFDDIKDDNQPVCFEKAVVMRHNEGGMARVRRMEVYDLIRCKARNYCNVSLGPERPEIGMTLLTRSGPRSFKNETAVARIFDKECNKVKGCSLMVANSNNLTFCEQVELMSLTDILISAHGAQMTNLFLMERNSSVMELFPKGWLELAGVGQYVFRWMSSWSGMRHRGDWRDPDGEHCPYSEDDRRCMWVYKNGRIGYNETRFSEWARNVLNEAKTNKLEEGSKHGSASIKRCGCS